MNHAAIRAGIYSWAVLNAPGIPVVWADQSAPQPAKPYITLRLSGPFRVAGFDETRYNLDGSTFTLCGQRRLMLGVQVFGTLESVTHQIAERLNFSLGKESAKEPLRVAGVAVADEGNLTNITVFIDSKWEPRFAFDVTFNSVATGSESPGIIETIGLTSTLSS